MEKDNVKEQELDYKELYLRTAADFSNYKRRIEKELLEMRDNAVSNVWKSIIPIYQDAKIGASYGEEGTKLIFKKIKDILKSQNIAILDDEYLDETGNYDFDDAYMNAQAVHYTNDKNLDNRIYSIIQDGFLYKSKSKGDIVIKHADVEVLKFTNNRALS